MRIVLGLLAFSFANCCWKSKELKASKSSQTILKALSLVMPAAALLWARGFSMTAVLGLLSSKRGSLSEALRLFSISRSIFFSMSPSMTSIQSSRYGAMTVSMNSTPSDVPGMPYFGSTAFCTVNARFLRPDASPALKFCSSLMKSGVLNASTSSLTIDKTTFRWLSLSKSSWLTDEASCQGKAAVGESLRKRLMSFSAYVSARMPSLSSMSTFI
mmetsp:Transcript_19058/g.35912  ORF Transcript_19058/g.35912 Transcript_19058/m.35912 type:complete len:215 (+) Transcript_19058:1008-1652(+)